MMIFIITAINLILYIIVAISVAHMQLFPLWEWRPINIKLFNTVQDVMRESYYER